MVSLNQFKKVFMACLILSSFSLSMGCVSWDEREGRNVTILDTNNSTPDELIQYTFFGSENVNTTTTYVEFNYHTENISIVDKKIINYPLITDRYKVIYIVDSTKKVYEIDSRNIFYQVKIGDKYSAQFYNDTDSLKYIPGLVY